MPPELELVRAWLSKGHSDLLLGERAVTGEPALTDLACFHAQQAMEKALKGLMVFRGIEPPRTHLLATLFQSCGPIDDRLSALEEQLVGLSVFAVTARYPDLEEQPSRERARQALDLARQAFMIILENLPDEVRP